MVMSGNFRKCLVNVCKCLKMYGNVWKWLDMFENGRNLEMSGKIRECLEMLGNFKNCFEMEILGTLLFRYCLLLFLELKPHMKQLLKITKQYLILCKLCCIMTMSINSIQHIKNMWAEGSKMSRAII